MDAQKQIQEEKIKELKKRYKVRNFKTTTESLEFTRKFAKAMSGIDLGSESVKDMELSEALDFFEPELLKYVVSNFVVVKEDGKAKAINYEKEFINDFETLLMVFMMAISFLTGKSNGLGKSQVAPQKETTKIIPTKR